jgi:hypothetical protein
MFKIIKTVFMLVGILVGLVVLFAAFHFYKAYKSGDIAKYFTKFAIESVIDESKLTPQQMDYLESGDYESLAEDMGENITSEQIDCAVEMLGEERANEIMENKNPTPQEVFKLSKCL